MTLREGASTGDVYYAFDQIVLNVERSLETVPPLVPGLDQAAVRRRLAQRFVEVTTTDFTTWIGRGEVPREPVSGGWRVDPDRGTVRVTPKGLLLGIAWFLGEWLRGVVAILAALFASRGAPPSRITLLHEAGGIVDGSDERLADFCEEGPILPLREASRIVIRGSAPDVQTDPRLTYTGLLLRGVAQHGLSWSGRVRLLVTHLLAPFVFIRASLRHPLALLLARDLALLPAYRFLDGRNCIEAVVITTSAFTSQPLWMTELDFPLHMMWYSQNFTPKMYKGDDRRPDLPEARHIRVDDHWVWTEGFSAYLRSLGSDARIHVVGPILWQLPESVDLGEEGPIRIVVFDVTPVKAGAPIFGAAINYYSPARMTRFVEDILHAAAALRLSLGRSVEVLLKHKRSADKDRYDASYLDLIDRLEEDTPWFKCLPHTTNLFGLLDQTEVSISVPYTSTAYVGAHLGRPAIYHDPGGDLVPCHEPHPLVGFSTDRDELLDHLIGALSQGDGVADGTERRSVSSGTE